MIKTVIFDMDGVIVDTEPVHHYAYNQHFKQLNIEVNAEMYASFTGNSTKNIFERLKIQFNLAEEVNALVETKRNLFNDAFDNKEDLYLLDGVEDLIKDLYDKRKSNFKQYTELRKISYFIKDVPFRMIFAFHSKLIFGKI